MTLKNGGRERAPGGPSADQILEKVYPGGRRGAAACNALQLYRQGTYAGFETADAPVPAEVYAKAPSQRSMIFHAVGEGGSAKVSTAAYDGRNGWIAAKAPWCRCSR